MVRLTVVVLTLATLAAAQQASFDTKRELDAFLFPADEEAIFNSMKVVFGLDNPAVLVSAAANAGPAYAQKVAGFIESPELRANYARLAKYLEVFGPCQRKQKPDTAGWWTRYTDDPEEAVCREVAKLILAVTLSSQIQY